MNDKGPPPIPPPVIGKRTASALGRKPVRGTEGLTPEELKDALERGGRVVSFQYCISLLVISLKRSSPIMFIKPGESSLAKGLPYCLISLFAGWWGIPWGPIWTVTTIATNLSGGKDFTPVLLSALGLGAAAAASNPMEISPSALAEREERKDFIMRLAWTVAALLILGIAWGGYKIYEARRNMPAKPGVAEFRAANRRIGAQGTGDSGNTADASQLAVQLSKSVSVLRNLNFEQSKEKSFIDENDPFRTYCDLRDDQCVFLIHVPELRRFGADAQKSLAQVTWLSAQGLLEKSGKGKSGMRLAVGLRGIAAYSCVLTGRYTSGASDTNTGIAETYDGFGCERQFESWFAPRATK